MSRDGYAEVRYQVTNLKRHAVFLDRCGDAVITAVDRWENGNWVNFSGTMCAAVISMGRLELGPGATHLATTLQRGSGDFRLRIGVSEAHPQAPRYSEAASNRFHVH